MCSCAKSFSPLFSPPHATLSYPSHVFRNAYSMVEVSFNHLLTSNYPADDSEIPGIQFALVDARNSLRLLEKRLADSELAEIENNLRPLDEQAHVQHDVSIQLLLFRDEQRARITKLQSALSPLRRFPSEILSLVFSFALPSRRKVVSMDSSSVIWSISQVCRLWRVIICEGMQYTWSSIEIDCMRMNGNLTNRLLQLALSRSGTRPLSIRFYFSHKNHLGVLPESEKRCLALLANESSRWEELELQYIPIAALDSLGETVQGRIPLLRRLVVENVPASHAADTPSTAKAFQVAPQLQHFSLSGFFRPSRFHLPWSQLNSYAGSFRDFRDFLFVLEYAENLHTCDVFFRNYYSGVMVNHPNLRTLRIRGELVGLARFHLASLQTLVLDELLIQDLGTVSSFLRRTPSVTSVEVYIPYDTGVGDSTNLLSEFMNACTNVTSLLLKGEFDIRSVCSLLNISEPTGQVLIPRLQHLSLSVLPTANEELANVLGMMLESRRRTSLYGLNHECNPLSSMTLLQSHVFRELSIILERLRPLEETLGLSIIVKTV